MNRDLVFNPFLRVYFEGAEKILITAPKPHSGLQKLEISKSEDSNLFDLFSDFAQTGLGFLNVEKDLSNREREMLCEREILIEPDKVQQKPLFACFLTDFDAADDELDLDSLFVNPTFRFEPFNLSNFTSWINEKHLSPRSASVWVKQPVTEIEVGYWLDKRESAIIENFAAGDKLPADVDPHLLRDAHARGLGRKTDGREVQR